MTIFRRWYYSACKGPLGSVMPTVIVLAIMISIWLVATTGSPALLRAGFVAAAVFLIVTAVLLLRAGNQIMMRLHDLSDALSLSDALRRGDYALAEFYTDGSAANPSLQLLHLKILELIQPGAILEIGSGQTTKMLTRHLERHPDAFGCTLEHDVTWMERMRPHVTHAYRLVELATASFTPIGGSSPITTCVFVNEPIPPGVRFSYILVDGCDDRGGARRTHARAGILQYLPAILAESFVIVLDDAERPGEASTVAACRRLLTAAKIDYRYFRIPGRKTQAVFVSPDLAFLRSV